MSLADAIASKARIPVSSLRAISPAPLVKGEASFLEQLNQINEERYRVPLDPPDNAPENLYAEIRVGNRIVAKVYNGGCAEMPNSLANLDLQQNGQGPALAQARAKQIAEALGGSVVMAKTAQTQAQWDARPPRRWTVDYEAMERDRRELEQSLQRRSLRPDVTAALQAQFIGQAGG